jgi:hypothetical protein
MAKGGSNLIEVRPSPTPDAALMLADLDRRQHRIGTQSTKCVAAALSAAQGGTIEGMIYPDRGLAIALARGGIGAASVVHIRGFEPMPAKRYLVDYVSLAPRSW